MNKDFRFRVPETFDFLTYRETADKVKKFGYFAVIESPSDEIMKAIQRLLDRCLERIKPAQDQEPLKGVFLYCAVDSAADARHSYGVCLCLGEEGEGAVIGLAIETLRANMPSFHDFVLYHELAHLGGVEHDDAFSCRFTELMFNYLFFRDIRLDGKDSAVPMPSRSGWIL